MKRGPFFIDIKVSYHSSTRIHNTIEQSSIFNHGSMPSIRKQLKQSAL